MLAIAAPLLRSKEQVVASIGLIGSSSFPDAGGEHKAVRMLLKALRCASERFGQQG